MVVIAKVGVVVVTTANIVVALHRRRSETALRRFLQHIVILLAVQSPGIA